MKYYFLMRKYEDGWCVFGGNDNIKAPYTWAPGDDTQRLDGLLKRAVALNNESGGQFPTEVWVIDEEDLT